MTRYPKLLHEAARLRLLVLRGCQRRFLLILKEVHVHLKLLGSLSDIADRVPVRRVLLVRGVHGQFGACTIGRFYRIAVKHFKFINFINNG